eukprot:TRINITY_DN1746_c0_g3_i1.p1 TRINITY_DN1746_c0_g3~~TRINITY_DN1746_c0_g3_i1.p1  ORF type:complete len:3456 (-),score=1009.01 TRINITY_DN1746_c0_g3_i1:120-9059(-)
MAAFTYNAAPILLSVTPNNGHMQGGYPITIQGSNLLGNGSDIYNVTVQGRAANIVGQTTAGVVVTIPVGIGAGSALVQTFSIGYGIGSSSALFVFNALGTISSVFPIEGPQVGGNNVTITGTFLSNGNFADIGSVTLRGCAAQLLNVSSTRIIVAALSCGSSGTGNVVIVSLFSGTTTLVSGYKHNPTGAITSIVPDNGPLAGTNIVTIGGTALHNSLANDIVSVRFCGINVTSVVSYTNTPSPVVVVRLDSRVSTALGTVELFSRSFGVTTLPNGYTYNPAGSITSITPSNGPLTGTNRVTIVGTFMNNGADVVSVHLAGVSVTTVNSQTPTQIVVTAAAGGSAHSGTVTVVSTSAGTTSDLSYTYNPAGVLSTIAPSEGPLVGGNVVTFTGTNLGSGSDITSVTINAQPTSIQSQTATSITVIAANGGSAGMSTVFVASTRFGTTTRVTWYMYNPDGNITGVIPPVGPLAGGHNVTVTGSAISNGNFADVVAVWLAGTHATILNVSTNAVVVRVIAAPSAVTANVTVSSISHGMTIGSTYTYNPVGVINAIYPASAPVAGGTIVTIDGQHLTNAVGGDLQSVTVRGTAVASVDLVTPTRIIVTLAASGSGTGNVVLTSIVQGVTTAVSAFTYNPVGTVSSVTPDNGPLAGGNTVTISGTAFGNGSDITQVRLKGILVSAIVSQTANSVVVVPTVSGPSGSGAVTIYSTSFGVATGMSYTYNPAPSISTVVPNNGPYAGTNIVTITGSNLGDPSSLFTVTLANVPVTVIQKGMSTVLVIVNATSVAGIGNTVVTSVTHGVSTLGSSYTFNPAGIISSVYPANGPLAGGNVVTIYGANMNNGVFADVVSVTFCGVSATIQAVLPSTIVVQLASIGAATTGDVVVLSTSHGYSTKLSAYTYNPAGTIASTVPVTGPLAGGNAVTITGSNLGNGTDISQVRLAGVLATIVAQTASTVTVTAVVTGSSTSAAVTVISRGYGTTIGSSYTYNPAGALSTATPPTGARVGGTTVTFTGTDLGSGTDITAVTVKGVPVNSIVSQSSTQVVVVTALSASSGTANVVVSSTSFGVTTMVSLYFYNPSGNIVSVTPNKCGYSGQASITISGSNLGDGSDITAIALNGVAVQSIDVQTPAFIIVTSGINGVGTGAVTINSVSYGTTTGLAFTYNPQGFVTNVVPARGPVLAGKGVSIMGTNLGDGTDITRVDLVGIAATIVRQNGSFVEVVSNAHTMEIAGNVKIYSRWFGITQGGAYAYDDSGFLNFIVPSIGPLAGGNLVTVLATRLGSGSDVTAATVCGLAATLVSQTNAEVVIRPPAQAGAGVCPVLTYSTSIGPSDGKNYQYNVQGSVTNTFPTLGPTTGGARITIFGNNLGNGSDITAVFLSNVAQTLDSQTTNQVVVLLAPSGVSVGNVRVESISFGSSVGASFTYVVTGVIQGIVPNAGPQIGGTVVTITGQQLSVTGSDVVSVTLNGVTAQLMSQAQTQIVVRSTAAVPGTGDLVITSSIYGTATSTDGWTYRPTGAISTVLPDISSVLGGDIVTIQGANLATTTDVTLVTLCGLTATVLNSSTTAVIVRSPSSNSACIGDVYVHSLSYGITNATAAFTIVPVIFAARSAADAYEGGAPVQVSFTLSTLPPGNVTVPLFVNSSQGYLDQSYVEFTPTDYNVPHTVNFFAYYDLRVDPNVPVRVTAGPSYCSVDALFSRVITNISVNAVNTDVASVVFRPVDFFPNNETLGTKRFLMREGSTRSFAVKLTSIPAAPVAVGQTFTVAESRLQLSQGSKALIFTPEMWNVTQAMTLTALEDVEIHTTMQWFYIRTDLVSPDLDYDAQRMQLEFLIADNNIPSSMAVVTSAANGSTSEWGGVATFYILPVAIPTVDVIVTISSSNLAEGVVLTPGYTLRPTDPNVMDPVAVNVQGVDDWVADGTITYSAVVQTSKPGESVSTLIVALSNLDDDVAGVNITANNMTVNETGSTAPFSVFTMSQPVRPVTFSVVQDQTSAAYFDVSPASVVFQPSRWRTPVEFIVTGKRVDSTTIDVTANVSVLLTSSDPNYHNKLLTFNATNVNIIWPVVASIAPLTMPQVGRQMNISGDRFMEGVQVFIGPVQIVNITVIDTTTSSFFFHGGTRKLLQDPIYGNRTGNLITFTPPALALNGYQNIHVRNPDGGSLTFVNATFYTSDCPEAGQFGIGTTCRPCDAGGICPGGNRMWASPGYWTPNEASGFVVACASPATDRCLGSPERFQLSSNASACGFSYRGDYCALCIDNYYEEAGRCVSCDTGTPYGVLIALQFLFLLLFLIALMFSSDDTLGNVAFVITNFRVLWVVSLAQDDVPAIVAKVFSALSMVAGDLGFTNPACSGIHDFGTIFFLNVGVLAAAMLPLAIAIQVRFAYQSRKMRNHVKYTPENSVAVDRELRRAKNACMARGVVNLAMFSYELVVVKSWSALFCIQGSSGLVLQADVNQPCFQGTHLGMFLMALGLVVGIGLVLPIYGLKLSIDHNRTKMPFSGMMKNALVDSMIGDFKEQNYLFGSLSNLFVDFTIATCSVFLSDFYSLYFTAAVIAILGAQAVVVVIRRPFLAWYKNAGLVLVITVAMSMNSQQIVNMLLPRYEDGTLVTKLPGEIITYVTLGLLGVYFIGLLSLVAYNLVIVPCRGKIQRSKRVLGGEIDGIELQRLGSSDDADETEGLFAMAKKSGYNPSASRRRSLAPVRAGFEFLASAESDIDGVNSSELLVATQTYRSTITGSMVVPVMPAMCTIATQTDCSDDEVQDVDGDDDTQHKQSDTNGDFVTQLQESTVEDLLDAQAKPESPHHTLQSEIAPFHPVPRQHGQRPASMLLNPSEVVALAASDPFAALAIPDDLAALPGRRVSVIVSPVMPSTPDKSRRRSARPEPVQVPVTTVIGPDGTEVSPPRRLSLAPVPYSPKVVKFSESDELQLRARPRLARIRRTSRSDGAQELLSDDEDCSDRSVSPDTTGGAGAKYAPVDVLEDL